MPMRWLVPGTYLVNALLLAGTLAAAGRVLTPPTQAPIRPELPATSPEPTARSSQVSGPPAVPTAVIVERGLFGRPEAETRAAAPARPAASAPPPSPPPALVGTAVHDRGGGAVFAAPGGRQELVVPGEAIDDQWRLVAVRRGAAVVEHRSGRRDTVPMHGQVAGPPLSALD